MDMSTELEDGQAPRAIRKKYVPLSPNLSLQLKLFPPTNELAISMMFYDENCGWVPVSKFIIPASKGLALIAALQEVL